jgi:hypothetical protein
MTTKLVEKIHAYNAFGIIRINREEIVVTITAVKGSRHVNRSVTERLDQPITEIEPEETSVASFGAWMEPGKRSQVTMHEMTELKSGVFIKDLPQVSRVLENALQQVKQSIGY